MYKPQQESTAPSRITPNEYVQAHRIITQVFVTGARVFGRAFAEAYKQASASQKFAQAQANNPTAANTLSASGLTLDEACKILNVAPPQTGAAGAAGEAYVGKVHEQFRRLFDMNDPKKGGSFYLQSKVLRARERIELEVRAAAERAEREEELRQGWKPKVYNDR
jgi:import inner membrane translocase subunit TIM16